MPDDGFVQVEPDSTGKKVDTSELSVNGQTVERQRVTIGDSATGENFASVTDAGALQVDGSAVTQPVSASALPLPAGAATSANQPAINGDGGALAHVTNFPGTQPVSGSVSVSNFPATQPVSAAALPLPAGAATSANQVSPGTSGTPSSSVASVQGVSGMTPVQVDGSSVTQPVSGTVTANQGSANATPWNDNLAQVGGAAISLGQQVAGSSFPVVLPTAQVSALAPLSTVTVQQSSGGNLHVDVDNFPASQPITGAVTTADGGVVGAGVPLSASQLGYGQIGNLQAVSLINNLPVVDQNLSAATSSDGPLFAAITGDPSGDFAGVNLLEAVLDPQSGLSLNVNQTNQPRQDVRGALMLSDAPVAIQWVTGGNTGPGPLIDTTGYESIVVSFSAAMGTVLFQTTNDPEQFTAAMNNAAGWLTAGAASPVTSVASAAGATYVFPATGRWFRLYCSVAGSAGVATIYLRVTPLSNLVLTQSVNVSQVGGSATTSTNVTGTLGVGGTTAVGVAPTIYPVNVGGVDASGLVRRVLTDTTGHLATAPAVDQSGTVRQAYSLPWNTTYGLPSLAVTDNTQFEGQSVIELLALILTELRIQSYYAFNLPGSLAQSSNFQPSEEPQVLRLDQSNPTLTTGMVSSLL